MTGELPWSNLHGSEKEKVRREKEEARSNDGMVRNGGGGNKYGNYKYLDSTIHFMPKGGFLINPLYPF